MNSVALQGSTVVSGLRNKTVKIWNLETGQCVHTLEGYSSFVWSVALQGFTVVPGSNDKTVKT